jgi:hypothetical protein
VTPEILSRMKELGRAEHNIVYDPPDGPVGAATSQTSLGECVIEFAHDAALPEGILWSGFITTLDRCRDTA